MAEYIEREALIQNIDEGFDKTDPCGEEQIGFLKCRRIAREIPSADVAQVRHGRWVKMDTTGLLVVEPVWNCSSCGYPAGVSVAGSKYCPNCGEKMDLEDNHDND